MGNAFSEFKGKNVENFQTRIRRQGDGYVVNGEKFYATGALFAHLVPIIAISEDDGKVYAAIAERSAPGLTVIDNWDGFGQRTTASGTVKIENVFVPADYVLPAHIAYDNPSPAGPQSQLLHAAIDLGIAETAIAKAVDLVRNHARPWIDAKQDHAWQDPYSIAAIGDLKLRFNAAMEVLEEAGDIVDEAIAAPDAENIGRAKIAVAEAKVLTTEIAILATNKLFELGGTRSTLAQHNLDRLWRDARTHTLHDPVRWKYSIIGAYYLTGKEPPLHSWI
jgi:SfnB family sulfur acquisition oxidoreductase